MRREGIRDVAAAGGDVERAPGLLRGGKGDQPLQALAGRVRFAGEVVRGSLAELLLDSVLDIDRIPVWGTWGLYSLG